MSTQYECPEVVMTGNCSKKEDCFYCKAGENKGIDNFNFNVNARSFVPKSKRNGNFNNINDVNNQEQISSDFDTKLKFNLNADEYKPRNLNTQITQIRPDSNDYQFEQQDMNEADYEDAEEFDMILKDIINNEVLEEIEDDEESDEDKWFPKYSNCECCKGFVYKCKGSACINLGACYCKMQDDCDDQEEC